jgi:hypothetical protein
MVAVVAAKIVLVSKAINDKSTGATNAFAAIAIESHGVFALQN